MLARRFYEVWVLGGLSKGEAEEIKRCLSEAVMRRAERLRIRIYNKNSEDLSYLDELKGILLENVSLSIVVESRDVGKLVEDLESHEGEITFIIGPSFQLPDKARFQGKLRIIEVRG
ncbi:MAG: hypothetical protein N3F65_05385 [Nitrososphaeria archaeon]|nr:hypothetical protein [Nitrososphaeria archaeon]